MQVDREQLKAGIDLIMKAIGIDSIIKAQGSTSIPGIDDNHIGDISSKINEVMGGAMATLQKELTDKIQEAVSKIDLSKAEAKNDAG
jgi:GrpB-like predicted nucleotidyltransferase (UPF0157 family)